MVEIAHVEIGPAHPDNCRKARYRADPTHASCASTVMPRFSFHVRQGKFWNACTETAFESNAEAREEPGNAWEIAYAEYDSSDWQPIDLQEG